MSAYDTLRRNSTTPAPMPEPGAARLRLRSLLATRRDPALSLVRVTLGVVIFPHGAQHLLGWFGGYGFSGTAAWMGEAVGAPFWLAALAIVLEFVAPFFLVVGLAGRAAAAAVGAIMAVSLTTHAPYGFFMNWFGVLPAGAEGIEYHLLALAMAGAVMLGGSGALSADRMLVER